MKTSLKERQLRNWKIRQEKEGYDVSNVNTLEDAKNFFKSEETSLEIIDSSVTVQSQEEIEKSSISSELEKLTQAELVKVAKKYGIEVTVFKKKVDIIAKIEDAIKNQSESSEQVTVVNEEVITSTEQEPSKMVTVDNTDGVEETVIDPGETPINPVVNEEVITSTEQKPSDSTNTTEE